ncbi:MAG TPA: hypothetical protein VJ044_11510 [Candidatus Hodarchaeales archaeon]|nr:hypothetical protein [Candidatus Hodarchaeales archaeon]
MNRYKILKNPPKINTKLKNDTLRSKRIRDTPICFDVREPAYVTNLLVVTNSLLHHTSRKNTVPIERAKKNIFNSKRLSSPPEITVELKIRRLIPEIADAMLATI